MVSYNNFETNEMFSGLTNYDIYMMNKNKKNAESRLFDKKIENKQLKISYEDYQRKLSKTPVKQDYKTYLIEQLGRKSPDRILSEEEFSRQSEDAVAQKAKSRKPSFAERAVSKITGGAHLRKGAKIFIAFYVLIVMAVASILIVMNTAGSNKSADAGSGVVEQNAVQPMTLNEEAEETNWFDRLCDSLNK